MSPFSTARLAIALCMVAACSFAEGSAPTHRFALLIGNNEGGEGTRPLLYSRDDATRLRDVMVRIGGVHAEDSMLILDETADDALTALGEIERRIRDAHAHGEPTSLFFYYSGHAKDGSLRLGKSKLPLESLKSRIAAGPADVRVAVFDACRSGTVTRTKGVRHAPAFEVESDATRAAKGIVILTSSASDEDSQESDIIGASYFSYHLAVGLLGGADKSGDGRVSLAEAYAYAYDHTVASTAESAAGPQHPTFSFDLAGNGDVMLTDLLQRKEGLVFTSSAPQGPYFVVDQRGVVVAELVKAEANRVIALSPGVYTLKRRLPDHLRIGTVTIVDGQLETLDETTFHDAKFSDDPVKGTGISTVYSTHWSIAAVGQYQSVFDQPSPIATVPSAPLIGGEATWHNLFGKGFGLGFDGLYGWTSGVATTRSGFSASYNYSVFTFGISGIAEFLQTSRWIPFVGVRIALDRTSRDFPNGEAVAQSFMTISPGLFAGVKFRISHSFSLAARARVHYLFFNADPSETRSFGYAEFGLSIDYEFRD